MSVAVATREPFPPPGPRPFEGAIELDARAATMRTGVGEGIATEVEGVD